MLKFEPEEILIERDCESTAMVRRLKAALPQVPVKVVDHGREQVIFAAPPEADFAAAKKRLYVAKHKGDFLKKCPGSDGQVCCNYFVINFASNCPMDCSYCYLQEYLADNSNLTVFSNIGDLIDEADQVFKKHRKMLCRVGTGEIT